MGLIACMSISGLFTSEAGCGSIELMPLMLCIEWPDMLAESGIWLWSMLCIAPPSMPVIPCMSLVGAIWL
ncbi:hypothetical protein D9M71_496200 [compost metagenome]